MPAELAQHGLSLRGLGLSTFRSGMLVSSCLTSSVEVWDQSGRGASSALVSWLCDLNPVVASQWKFPPSISAWGSLARLANGAWSYLQNSGSWPGCWLSTDLCQCSQEHLCCGLRLPPGWGHLTPAVPGSGSLSLFSPLPLLPFTASCFGLGTSISASRAWTSAL